MAGSQFIKYFTYVISALKDLGKSGTPAEVRDLIAQKLHLSEDELDEQYYARQRYPHRYVNLTERDAALPATPGR